MQAELDADYPDLEIQILGVNEIGYDRDNDEMVADRALPWLQDDAQADVWESWGVTYRDVWILDGENEIVDIYNLTDNTLGDPSNYSDLLEIFVSAASD